MIRTLLFILVAGILINNGLWYVSVLLTVLVLIWFVRRHNDTHPTPFGMGTLW